MSFKTQKELLHHLIIGGKVGDDHKPVLLMTEEKVIEIDDV